MSPLTHRISRSTWYLLAIIYASMLTMVAGNIVYSNHVAEENQRQLCGVVVMQDDTYHKTPPTTQTAKELAKEMHRLRTVFKC